MKLLIALICMLFIAVEAIVRLIALFIYSGMKLKPLLKRIQISKNFLSKSVSIVFNLLLLVTYSVVVYTLLEWLLVPMRHLHSKSAIIFLVMVFSHSVIWMTQVLLVILFSDRSPDFRNSIRFGFMARLQKELFPFITFFISFAYLTFELSTQDISHYQNISPETWDWLRYSFSTALSAISFDIRNIFGEQLSSILPKSTLAISIDLFFRLFVKFIVLSIFLKFFSLFMHKKINLAKDKNEQSSY